MDLITDYSQYKPPNMCIRCGTGRVPAVQFERTVELTMPDGGGNHRLGDAWVFLCEPCTREAAALLGALFPEQVAEVAGERDALRQSVAGLQARVDKAEAEVQAALTLLRATNPEWDEDDEDDEDVSEVDDVPEPQREVEPVGASSVHEMPDPYAIRTIEPDPWDAT